MDEVDEFYKKQEKRRLGPDGRVLYVPPKGCSLSRSPFSASPWELPTTAGEEIWGSVNLLLLFIFFNIVACMKVQWRGKSFKNTIKVDCLRLSRAYVFSKFILHLRRCYSLTTTIKTQYFGLTYLQWADDESWVGLSETEASELLWEAFIEDEGQSFLKAYFKS